MGKLTLKAARVACGLTQHEMAEKLGISRETVVSIETGKTKIKPFHIYAYASATGFKASDFLLPNELAKS